jgi:hypothetical protein
VRVGAVGIGQGKEGSLVFNDGRTYREHSTLQACVCRRGRNLSCSFWLEKEERSNLIILVTFIYFGGHAVAVTGSRPDEENFFSQFI